jgi:hypothetical protein
MMRFANPLAVMLACSFIGAVSAGDREDVIATMEQWRQKLAEACAGTPDKITALYATDGVLWGTLSPTIRSDPAAIHGYFASACQALPKLTVEFKDSLVRIYGDTAVNSGSYVFSFEKDGAVKALPARYSFTLVKRDGKWFIVDHHSSRMPGD